MEHRIGSDRGLSQNVGSLSNEGQSMLRRYGFLMLFLAFILTGCFPLWIHDYYKPNAADGIVKKSACHGSSGPPDTVEYKENDVVVDVKSSEVEKGYGIFIRIIVPEGRQVRLVKADVRASIPSQTDIYTGTLKPILGPYQEYWTIDGVMIGKTSKLKSIIGTSYLGAYYAVSTTITMPKSTAIKIRLPELEINGIIVKIPEITFSKDKYWEFFMPMNC